MENMLNHKTHGSPRPRNKQKNVVYVSKEINNSLPSLRTENTLWVIAFLVGFVQIRFSYL